MTKPLPLPSLSECRIGPRSVPAFTDDALFDACGVRIAFMMREGGTSVGPYASLNTGDHVEDDMAHVLRNRAIALEALGAPNAPVIVPNQVHGTNIVRATTQADVPFAIEQAQTGVDAVVVDAPGVVALLNFADCLPLIIVAPSGRFAVVHAGWRGALAGIAGKAVRALADGAGDASALNAYIGPHIRSECFETGAEIAGQFADRYGSDVLEGKRHVSLARVVANDLMGAGLAGERIADAGVCTVCNAERFFSYRASGGVCGRQAAAAVRHVIEA